MNSEHWRYNTFWPAATTIMCFPFLVLSGNCRLNLKEKCCWKGADTRCVMCVVLLAEVLQNCWVILRAIRVRLWWILRYYKLRTKNCTIFWWKRPWSNFRYYPGICLEGLRKITNYHIQDSRCFSRNSNQATPTYEHRALPLRQSARM
jgi:hypothetical protein